MIYSLSWHLKRINLCEGIVAEQTCENRMSDDCVAWPKRKKKASHVPGEYFTGCCLEKVKTRTAARTGTVRY
jgi:hypothetical protein